MPLISLILLFVLVMDMVGGEGLGAIVIIALLACWLIQLSSSMFGISGFRWCHKYGTLSKAGMIACTIAQLIPCADVIGSILCYIIFRKDAQPKSQEEAERMHQIKMITPDPICSCQGKVDTKKHHRF